MKIGRVFPDPGVEYEQMKKKGTSSLPVGRMMRRDGSSPRINSKARDCWGSLNPAEISPRKVRRSRSLEGCIICVTGCVRACDGGLARFKPRLLRRHARSFARV